MSNDRQAYRCDCPDPQDQYVPVERTQKINQDVQEYFASVVSGMNMVILKQHALNGLC
jgi:hypothetical protein